jgi:hypothetical protein
MKKITFTEMKKLIDPKKKYIVTHDFFNGMTVRMTPKVEDHVIVIDEAPHIGGICYNQDDKFYVKNSGILVMKSFDDGDCELLPVKSR